MIIGDEGSIESSVAPHRRLVILSQNELFPMRGQRNIQRYIFKEGKRGQGMRNQQGVSPCWFLISNVPLLLCSGFQTPSRVVPLVHRVRWVAEHAEPPQRPPDLMDTYTEVKYPGKSETFVQVVRVHPTSVSHADHHPNTVPLVVRRLERSFRWKCHRGSVPSHGGALVVRLNV